MLFIKYSSSNIFSVERPSELKRQVIRLLQTNVQWWKRHKIIGIDFSNEKGGKER